MQNKKNYLFLKSFINSILESDKNKKTGDYVKIFIKNKQEKISKDNNVIQKK